MAPPSNPPNTQTQPFSLPASFTRLLSSPLLHGLLIFICFSLLYLSTAPRTNVSYADSDLLTTIGYQLGVAHPPGYPLYISLVHIFTHLPLPFTIAFKAHLLSILLQSASLSFIFLSCFLFLSILNHSQPTRSRPPASPLPHLFISHIATISLGLSKLYWLYGIVAEKYALNHLFLSVTILLITSITYTAISRSGQSSSSPPRLSTVPNRSLITPFFILAIIIALALNHHHTFLLYLPALALFGLYYLPTLKPHLRYLLPTFIFFLILPVLLLIFINSREVPISWRFDPSLQGLYTFLTRRELSGYLLTQGSYRGIYLDPVSIEEILEKLPVALHTYLNHFGILPSLLFIFGLSTTLRYTLSLLRPTSFTQDFIRSPRTVISRLNSTLYSLHPTTILFLCYLLITLFTTIFIPLYLDWPSDLSTQAIRIRMYLAGYVIIPLFITYGLHQLPSFFPKLHYRLKPTLLFSLMLIYLTLFRLPATYPELNLRRFNFVSRFYTDTLTSLPPNSVMACISDVSCFAAVYAQQIDGVRPDVLILPHATRIFESYLSSYPDTHGFTYTDNPQLYLDYLSWNQSKRPVYIQELQKFYFDLMGMNFNLVSYVPQGYLGRITPPLNSDQLLTSLSSSPTSLSPDSSPDKDTSNLSPTDLLPLSHFNPNTGYTFSEELINTSFPSFDQARFQLKASLAQKHLLNAMTYQRHLSTLIQKRSRERQDITLVQNIIRQEMDLATRLSTDLPDSYQQQVKNVTELLPALSFDQYVPGEADPTPAQILVQSETYLTQNQPGLALIGPTALLFTDPTDPEPRLQLARIYHSSGDTPSAIQELQNILKYHPDHQLAQDQLATLLQSPTQDNILIQ